MLNDIYNRKRWFVQALFMPGRRIKLHSMLTYCGFETRTTTDYSFHGLQRGSAEFAIWQYTLAGEGNLVYEGTRYKMHAGDAMLLHIPHDHRYFFEPSDEYDYWTLMYMTISGQENIRIMRQLELNYGPVIHQGIDSEPVRYALDMFQGLRAGDGSFRNVFQASAAAYSFVMALCNDLTSDEIPDENRDIRYLRNAVDFCMKHYAEDISVDDMAKAAGYSRFHFSRIFRDTYGMPPATFLKDIRLKNAMRMLQMETLNVKEISALCGFNDESYFCKLFKKAYGNSPQTYRCVPRETNRLIKG